MKHYITPDNQRWGFDETQTDLIPKDAVLISDTYSMDQHPYITLVKGKVFYNQVQHDADVKAIEDAKLEAQATKQSALNKLMALGLTEEEALALGVK